MGDNKGYVKSMKIIYITGESAQGKSTFAKLLKGFHFEMDRMYVAYKIERDILYDFDQSDWTTWENYPDLEIYKRYYYNILKSILPEDCTLIVDSVTTAIKKERDIIEEVFNPEEVEMIILKSKNHKENYLNKFKNQPKPKTVDDFNYKNKVFREGLEPCENTTIYERI